MRLDIADHPWLGEAGLVAVFDAIAAVGGEARVAGGAVRNALLGEKVRDVDLAATLEPPAIVSALGKAGIKVVPTGIEHGTVTAISGGTPYEITTLREDVETDGRRALVRFGTSWKKDAERRDLTMNALYCDRYGTVHDPIGGLPDLKARQVRFIGDAARRIEEDYLRILRFFRFFACYGSGRPDAEGLKAAARLKPGLGRVSAERIWSEFKKILAAPDPGRALLWMRTTGVLTQILPESEKWGIDLVRPLIEAETRFSWPPDVLLRLETMFRPTPENVERLVERLKISNACKARLAAWAVTDLPKDGVDARDLKIRLYRGNRTALLDRLRLNAATAILNGDEPLAGQFAEAVEMAESWDVPVFPVSGKDLKKAGLAEGRELGGKLGELEQRWIDSGFSLTRHDLLAMM
ncbi:MAG: CCA tRNA nucleotidyltransferase [Nitratireductor sp.]|nr:CCA tRNA nucleotidyltransferase [Nitratireductor sp.]